MHRMRAAVIAQPIGIDGLRIEEIARPEPSADETLVKVRAATVISSELATISGASDPNGPQFPMILGNEFAGEVVACPSGRFLPGQKVTTAWAGHGWTRNGGHAEYVVSPTRDLIPYTSTLPFTVVAAMPKAFTRTAIAKRTLKWQPGQSLLIRGGTSGIGIAAASVASSEGVRVISTTRSPSKAKQLEALGFGDVVLDNGHMVEQVRAKYPDGVDNALEIVGYPAVAETLCCVREGGTVGMIGFLDELEQARNSGEQIGPGRLIAPSPFHYIPHDVRLTTINHKSLPSPEHLAEFFGDLQPWIDGVEDGRYRVVIDRIFPFSDIAEAFRYRAQSNGLGKIVISFDDAAPQLQTRE